MSSQSSSPVSATPTSTADTDAAPWTHTRSGSTQSREPTSGSPNTRKKRWVFDSSRLRERQALDSVPSVREPQTDDGDTACSQPTSPILSRSTSLGDLPPLVQSPKIRDHLDAYQPTTLPDIRESSKEYPQKPGQLRFVPDDREENGEPEQHNQQSKASSPSDETVDYFTLQKRESWDWEGVFDDEPISTGATTYGHSLTPKTSRTRSISSSSSPTRKFKDLKRKVSEASRALRGDK